MWEHIFASLRTCFVKIGFNTNTNQSIDKFCCVELAVGSARLAVVGGRNAAEPRAKPAETRSVSKFSQSENLAPPPAVGQLSQKEQFSLIGRHEPHDTTT